MLTSYKRVWMIDDLSSKGARILMRGLAEGLRENGFDVHVFAADHQDPTVLGRMKEDLLACDPDLIVLANHPIQHLLDQIKLDSFECPTIVWLFDDPYIMGEELFQQHETVFAADPSFIEGAKARGAKRVFFVPVAAPESLEAVAEEKYRFPVVYAGSIFINEAFRHTISPQLRPIVRELIPRKLKRPTVSFDELLNRMDTAKLLNLQPNLTLSITLPPGLTYFLYTECNRHWRLQFLQALEPLGLHLFGNKAWLKCIPNSLKKRFHPPIDAFTEYPSLVKSAAVNININSLQGISAPTLRDFQIPYYGGFQLSAVFQDRVSDWSAHDAENRFQLDRFPWPEAAQTPEELHDLAQRYLDDGKSRQEWTAHANEVIETHHTFAHRIQQLIPLQFNFV